MNDADTKKLMQLAGCDAPRPFVLTSRTFRRNAQYGTIVRRSTTRNFDCSYEVEHIEMECPHLKWTERGPVWDKTTSKSDEEA